MEEMISPSRTIWQTAQGNERQPDQLNAMTSRFVKMSVVLLLGFILAGQGVFMTSAGNTPIVSHAGCKCCHSGTSKCAMPVCCAQPANHVPFAPASLPAPSQNEWHALAASVSSALTLPSIPIAGYSPHFVPPVSPTAIPLFQRNCSYLI